MHAIELRRFKGETNAFLRSTLGLAIFLAALWLYWSMQFRI